MAHSTLSKCQTIAVIGGGITGIASALRLAASRAFEVTLFEQRGHLGGLSDDYEWNGVRWDRFYHVILSTDIRTIHFITDLGLGDDIFWRDTRVGFYGDGKLVPLSTLLDFVQFPFMAWGQKIRMILGILYGSSIKDPSKLDRIYARAWLISVFGRRVYESVWEPLLRSKLGSARENVSAAFIWATISRLYGTRQGLEKKEKMGHVRGGYSSIISAAQKRMQQEGINLKLGEPVTSCGTSSSAFCEGPLSVETRKGHYEFDKVLFTTDCPSILKCVGTSGNHPHWERLAKVHYLGIICVYLILSRKLSGYYVTNLLDRDLPFTGIIEVTNIVQPESVGKKHLVYLPKYMPSEDLSGQLSDEAILQQFIEGLKKVHPDLLDSDILHGTVFRETHVQPLQELGYLDRMQGHATPLPGVFIANTAMIANSTLNNNAAITIAQDVADRISASMPHE